MHTVVEVGQEQHSKYIRTCFFASSLQFQCVGLRHLFLLYHLEPYVVGDAIYVHVRTCTYIVFLYSMFSKSRQMR